MPHAGHGSKWPVALRCHIMVRRPLAAAFGLPAAMEQLYRQVMPGSGSTVDAVAHSLLVTPEQLIEDLGPLLESDIVRIDGGRLSVASPSLAVSRYIASQAVLLADAGAHLGRLAEAIPMLAEMGVEAPHTRATEIDGEIVTGDNVPATLNAWIRESTGDLCFLRPDQWRLPSESDMALVVDTAVRANRRVRSIYPARALQEAPAVLLGRAAIGEQIRVVPEVSTRMAIVGSSRALIPDPLGVGNERRIVVRQQSIVELFTAYFDQLWDRATAVPTLDRGQARPDLRRLLLAQLADGAKDEQIARTLDISLRTVRRRIAGLMVELGVDTRFQAGVEAVRRGWL
jgi:hypothetical protein